MSRAQAVERLLSHKSSWQEAHHLTKGRNLTGMLRLGDRINKEDVRHITADYSKRVVAKNQKLPPAPTELTPLEVAYRAQSSRLFKPAFYERKDIGLDPFMKMFAYNGMSLENHTYKSSDFQPTIGPGSRPPSQFAVQNVRDAHTASAMNASTIGSANTRNVTQMDTRPERDLHQPVLINDVNIPNAMYVNPVSNIGQMQFKRSGAPMENSYARLKKMRHSRY